MSTPTPHVLSDSSGRPLTSPIGTELPAIMPQQRPLNAMDCAMLSVSRQLRAMGYSGFETQALVWLHGRVDENRLQRAISLLARKFPAVTSRLADVDKAVPHWRSRPDADCTLDIVTLQAPDDEAVWDCAAGLLSTPRELEREDPISFRLLRRPERGDVFVMQYSHAVMDNNAASYVLDELHRLFANSGNESDEAAARQRRVDSGDVEQPSVEMRDALAGYLDRFPRKRRWRAAWRTADLRIRKLRGKPLTIGQSRNRDHSREFRILSRSLDADATREFQRRVAETCGFPAISMGILASVFRSLARVSNERCRRRRRLIAGIGVDLGLRGKDGPIFQNLVSLMPVAAEQSQLHDRDGLIRTLHYQVRDRLAHDADLGFIQLADVGRSSRRLVRWATLRLLKRAYSMWYAYFAAADNLADGFCDVPVENLSFTGPAWSPLGVTLIVNRFRGRLHFQATYLPDVVPRQKVEDFLNLVLSDLSSS